MAANKRDYYEVLGVSRNASETDTWLYAIDRNGALLTTVPLVRFFKRFVQNSQTSIWSFALSAALSWCRSWNELSSI